MAHLSGRAMVGVASLAIVVAITQVADAQRDGRGFGRGPGGPAGAGMLSLRLASNERVQEELNFTDEQKQQISQIQSQQAEQMRELRDQGRGREAREARERAAEQVAEKLSEVLDDEQEKRLAGTVVQVNVALALRDPLVQKQIDLTADQRSQLREAQTANMRAMRDAMRDLEGASDEERRAKMEEIGATAQQNVMAALTTEQQAQLDDLKAKGVEVDLGRGFRARGEGRGERRGEGRPRRGRGSI